MHNGRPLLAPLLTACVCLAGCTLEESPAAQLSVEQVREVVRTSSLAADFRSRLTDIGCVAEDDLLGLSLHPGGLRAISLQRLECTEGRVGTLAVIVQAATDEPEVGALAVVTSFHTGTHRSYLLDAERESLMELELTPEFVRRLYSRQLPAADEPVVGATGAQLESEANSCARAFGRPLPMEGEVDLPQGFTCCQALSDISSCRSYGNQAPEELIEQCGESEENAAFCQMMVDQLAAMAPSNGDEGLSGFLVEEADLEEGQEYDPEFVQEGNRLFTLFGALLSLGFVEALATNHYYFLFPESRGGPAPNEAYLQLYAKRMMDEGYGCIVPECAPVATGSCQQATVSCGETPEILPNGTQSCRTESLEISLPEVEVLDTTCCEGEFRWEYESVWDAPEELSGVDVVPALHTGAEGFLPTCRWFGIDEGDLACSYRIEPPTQSGLSSATMEALSCPGS